MKHIRMFENAEQAAAILPTLEYNTLSAIRGESGISLKPGVMPGPDYSEPFYIDVRGTVTLAATSGLQMSTDGETWTDTVAGDLPTGKTYFRVASDQTSPLKPDWTENDNSDYDVGGNINSLVKTAFEKDTTCYNFYIDWTGLFQYRAKLKSASNLILPATTLTEECYTSMFMDCTSLTTAPALPATTLAEGCYSNMFQGCTSLTTAPELPATTLAGSCYGYMFQGCTSLTTAPALPATTLAEGCYSGMFQGCTSLTTAPELPATTLASDCYNEMFRGCTSLTTAPALPATTMVSGCYNYMFQNCTSLTTAPELPAMTLAEYCYNNMFIGCTSLTSAPELPATTLASGCYSGMFIGCTSLTSAPELPATTLAEECYQSMFFDCESLNEITIYADDISASNCTSEWVTGVAESGQFHNLGTAEFIKGENGCPVGWTPDQPEYIVEDDAPVAA